MQSGKVLIVGGTGFLGYHVCLKLIEEGYQVSVLSLPPMPQNLKLPSTVKVILQDLNKLSDHEVIEILSNHDALVYAAGVDDRTMATKNAFDFFYEANVIPSARLTQLAVEAGIKKAVWLSSYFLYFNRIWPELHLEKHPYVYSRVEQARQIMEMAKETSLELCILELPYIFGSMPGRIPLWKPLVNYITSYWPFFYTKGGTNIIAVDKVADSIVGAVKYGKAGENYTIGDVNLSWKELITKFSALNGRKRMVITLPDFMVQTGMFFVQVYFKIRKKEMGLLPLEYIKVQTRNTYFDPNPAQKELQFSGGGINEALYDTIEACKIEPA